jgi:hypothetical protein
MSRSQIVEGFSLSHAQVLDGGTSFLNALGAAAAENQDIYGVNDSGIDPDVGDYDNEGDDAVLSTWSWFNYADVTVQAGYISFPLMANLTGRTIDTIGAIAAVNEVQTVTVTGSPTAGTFTLTFLGQTTGTIAYNATNAAVQTALEALNNIDTGDVTVTGPAGTWVVTFGGKYAALDVAMLGLGTNALTGGTTPTVVITETTKGKAANAAAWGMDLWHEDSFNVAPKPMVVRIPSKDADGNPRSLALGLYKVQFRPITFDGPSFKDGLKINYAGRAVMSSTDEVGQTFTDGKKRAGRILSFV